MATHNVNNFISLLLQERTMDMVPVDPGPPRKRKDREERTIGNYKGYLDRAVIDKPEPAPGAVPQERREEEEEDPSSSAADPRGEDPRVGRPIPSVQLLPSERSPRPWKEEDQEKKWPDREDILPLTPEKTTPRRGGDIYDISGTQVGTVGGGRIEGGVNIGGDVTTQQAPSDGKTPQERRAEPLPAKVQQAVAANPEQRTQIVNNYYNHGTIVGTMGGGRISGGINIAGNVGTYGGQRGRGDAADARGAALRSITGKGRLGSSLTSRTSDIGGRYDPKSDYLTALKRRYGK